MRTPRRLRPPFLASALTRALTRALTGALAPVMALASAAALLPASAAVLTSGDFGTINPNGSFADGVFIGLSGSGQFNVNGGSQLTVAQLYLGYYPTGNGALTVTGNGSRAFVTFANSGSIDVGGQGRGSISVLNGASFQYGSNSNACQLNCRIFVSNGAGSSGNLLVSGAGSSLSTVGGIVAGNASVFSQAADGISYGAPGGTSIGTVQVTAGGTVTSSLLSIAQPGGGQGRTGNETSRGSVVVDGANSAWTLLRTAAQTGSRTLVFIGSGQNTDGSLTVSNGGRMTLDGSTAAGEFTGINVGAAAVGSTATGLSGSLTVKGTGSAINFTGTRGFINLGRSAGGTASMVVSDGGRVSGSGAETGLTFVNVGRGGSTATLAVSGAGSLLRMNGANSQNNSDTTTAPGAGAFFSVGRADSGLRGNGSVVVSGGGRIAVDTLGVQLANVNGQTGMAIGQGAGSVGSLLVTGSGSRLDIMADSGMTPYVVIGRDGSSGVLNITSGGQVEVNSSHVSVPNLGASNYLPGDASVFDIGRRSSGTDNNASSGVVNVSGAGSALVMGGGADSLLFVGRGNGGSGSLNISNGGSVRSTSLLVGQEAGASGVVNVNGGSIVISGLLNGGPSAGQSGGIAVGRGGTGTLNITGGSVVTIGSTFSGASLSAAGSSTAPGGTGTINISGGSSVTLNGPNALVSIGREASSTAAGTGQLNLSDAGTRLTMTGSNGRVLIGGQANTAGAVTVGSGATLSASGSVGNAFDANGQTAGTGTLVVNGTVNTPTLTNGSNGTLGGSGVINGSVVNYGLMNPGQSPGRLTINGGLDNRNGTIVLEVQSLGNGQFAMDEVVLGDPTQMLLEGGNIQFQFLGNTNPLEFQTAGLFEIDNFFKELNSTGAVVGLGAARLGLFDNVRYSATSATYGITNFSFSAANGASFGVAAVPAPATLALALLALAMLGVARRNR